MCKENSPWSVRLKRQGTRTTITKVVLAHDDIEAMTVFFKELKATNDGFEDWVLELTIVPVQYYNRYKLLETFHVPS